MKPTHHYPQFGTPPLGVTLDAGESEAIAMSLEWPAGLLVMDESSGRAMARNLNIRLKAKIEHMTKSFPLLPIAIFLAGSLPADCQEASLLIDRPSDLPSIPGEKGPRIASAEQEAEIRRLVEDFVINDQETKAEAAEDEREAKFIAEAEKSAREGATNSAPPPDDPFAGPLEGSPPPPSPAVLEELRAYHQKRIDAFKRLASLQELAFPILAAHLDDARPTRMHWNHKVARTVGGLCYQVIHDQLTFFPAGYTNYGLNRTGRDGDGHKKPYWRSNPYEEAGGLKKWLQQNQGLSFRQMRIKCLTWLLEEERKIGVVDPAGYFVHVLPLELGILELQASDGQDVAEELARVRRLSRTRSADQVPKELLPDGPLPEVEEMHAGQKTADILKACPEGHTMLKDIPILYGTFPLLTKEPADWNEDDKALAKRRDAMEILIGGEVDDARDPRFQTKCLTCGFRYEIMLVPDLGGNWVKDGHEFDDFAIPFSQVARSLPFGAGPETDLATEVNKEGKVVTETVTVTIGSNEKPEMVAKIRKWIDEHGFKHELLHDETPPFPRLYEQPVEDDQARFYIEIRTSPGGKTRITFLLERID